MPSTAQGEVIGHKVILLERSVETIYVTSNVQASWLSVSPGTDSGKNRSPPAVLLAGFS
jgi:hypothetical protein